MDNEQRALQKSVIQAEAGHTALYSRLIHSLNNGSFHIVCDFWIFLSGNWPPIRHPPHKLMGKTDGQN